MLTKFGRTSALVTLFAASSAPPDALPPLGACRLPLSLPTVLPCRLPSATFHSVPTSRLSPGAPWPANLTDLGHAGAALLACTAPVVLAYNTAPSSTFLNQALACGGWGLYLWVLARQRLAIHRGSRVLGRLWPVLLTLGLLAAAGLTASLLGPMPLSLVTGPLAMIAAAVLVLWVGAALSDGGRLASTLTPWMFALLAAGVLSALIALVQVFVPQWADNTWIAQVGPHARAAGNLRQPNHLSTLLLWSLVAVVWLLAAGRLSLAAALPLSGLLVFALVLSASRTGLLGLLLLALWGALDRRLASAARGLLIGLPVAYAAMWWGLDLWRAVGAQSAEDLPQLKTEGDISSSRFAIWSDTLSLIARHPWWGVGFGEFNRAWSLTAFPQRPTAFFDHTHNLPLHLAVELGLPAALLMTALLCWALWRAFRAGSRADDASAVSLRCVFMIVLLVAVHSQLEYPLWYSYFLLPTAFALGLCLGAPPAAGPADATTTRPPLLPWLGALMVAASIHAVVDYWRVVVIFAPGDSPLSLAERIAAGQRSVYFAHHAHYAAATTAPRPAEVLPSFEAASHFLLDTRLMMAWAKAYREAGDVERARHLADRLREFRNPASQTFFDACTPKDAEPAALPFQCTPAGARLDERDFR